VPRAACGANGLGLGLAAPRARALTSVRLRAAVAVWPCLMCVRCAGCVWCGDVTCGHQEELELQANKVAYKGTPPGILGPDSQVTLNPKPYTRRASWGLMAR
jgi:hypothetical protein